MLQIRVEVHVRLVQKKPVLLLPVLLLFAQMGKIDDFYGQANQFGLAAAEFICRNILIITLVLYLKSSSIAGVEPEHKTTETGVLTPRWTGRSFPARFSVARRSISSP